ncbi:DUF1707 SHOCT-like domain-containing protein [Antrihabitans stalactiti]|uniref:DUF1707 domain-containing protein n=1 Tax=Antrihabitans stalactiti TaxID=2584121 RepID=A0A848KH18_9NOCA|nr:DUF1707 domain-containing protein [Antrihabitans stalactiti]NMN98065.1 DUF1707 domain-containing protein [Antrihabitans stalactiti]
MIDDNNSRVSDAERERTARSLAAHVGAGRLNISEFDSRVARAYAATTRSELDSVMQDLPDEAPTKAVRRERYSQSHWLPWLGVGVLCIAIWAATSIATWNLLYPWPVWVIGPWGLALLARTRLETLPPTLESLCRKTSKQPST